MKHGKFHTLCLCNALLCGLDGAWQGMRGQQPNIGSDDGGTLCNVRIRCYSESERAGGDRPSQAIIVPHPHALQFSWCE